jgi:hypothetical protein
MHAFVLTYGLSDTPTAHAELASQLGPAFDAIPGLVRRTPLENRETGRFGAFFVFDTKAAFDRFVASELYAATYGGSGLARMSACDFAIPEQGGAR